jgi:UDP-glucose 4-epimerase
VQAVVTGGAGFIGSTLVDALLADGYEVRVLDDLSTGYEENVAAAADLTVADVTDEPAVRATVEGADVVFHEAAHRAVLHSVEQPLATDSANVHGTLTVLKAAADAGVRRFVYASSSSVYGGAEQRPTPETAPLQPRSPYAVTKLTGEHYCRVFSELYGLDTVALRYFNVFGPRQRPDSMYAAVIPLFMAALLEGTAPEVHGDGRQSRDFTYVDDVVRANLAAAAADRDVVSGRVYNIAGGREHSLLDLLAVLEETIGTSVAPVHVETRAGDLRHSCADATRARADLGWEVEVPFDEGLRRTVEWVAARTTKGAA